jgi:GT2 family glycosyltransferase
MIALTKLQSLMLPEAGLCTEPNLFVRLQGYAALSLKSREICFLKGGSAEFNTYYNLFNAGKWAKNCGLKSLILELAGEGVFEVNVFLIQPEHSWEQLANEVVTLEGNTPLSILIDNSNGFDSRGIIFFKIRAFSETGTLRRADWQTNQVPLRFPELMLSITTFNRQAAVARTVKRFENFVSQSPLKDYLHLTVVDNGRNTEIANSEHLTVIANENLGGSGGFARGLLEAQRRKASICLFMDDDAAVHMQAIERTWAFLAYAENPKTAVAGAVANARHRWQLWENGALFDRVCQPLHMGLDLRDFAQVLRLEFDSTATQKSNFYGGWWYFAFPVSEVKHMPFPFFVRGDDVSFSLVHDFNIVTLPGVISYQDEDFSTKETPLTVYLDLRSHLAHHLSLPSMEIGRKGIVKIIIRFYLRSLLSCHYETLTAVNLAIQDVLAGPSYFKANADMAARRKEIGALYSQERWQSEEMLKNRRSPDRVWLPAHKWFPRFLMKISLNGHFLPGFKFIGNQITLPAAMRGQLRPVWGASEISYISADGNKSYIVRHNKIKAIRATVQVLRHMLNFWWSYKATCNDWRQGYQAMTQRPFWTDILHVTEPIEAQAGTPDKPARASA